jgi:PAS domain S-box-containing protein
MLLKLAFKEFIETGTIDISKIYELQQTHKNGSTVWTETTTNFRLNSDGDLEIVGITRNIDHKKKLKEQLRKTEEKYLLALNATKDGIWDWNVETDKAFFSPAYFEMLGFEKNHQNNDSKFWESRLHPDDYEKAIQINEECIEGKTDEYTSEFRMKKKDGTWLPILSRGKVVSRDDNGKATRIVGTHVDMSQIKKAEKAKEISEQMFRMISANTSDMFIIHNPDYSLNYISESIYDLTGYTAEEYMNFDPMQNVHPDDHELLKEKLYELLSDKEKVIASYRLFKKNGAVIWVETRSKKVRNTKGEIESIISSTNDVTEKRDIIEKLTESEERYRNLVETASDAIYMVSRDGSIIDVNNAACKSTGWTREELLQKSIVDVDPNFTPQQLADFWDRFPDNHPESFQTTHKKRDGTIFPVEISGAKYVLKNKSFYYGIARDISDRKIEEQKLIESERNYRELISHIPSVVYKYSSKKGAIFWSDRVKEVLGFSPDDLKRDPLLWINSVHPDYKGIINKFSTDQEIGQQYGIEYKILRADGKWIWLFDSLIHKEKYNDETIIVGQAIDITKRKEAELALKEREELFAALYRNIGEGIAFTDPDDVFLYANPTAENIFGVQESGLKGRAVRDFLSEDEMNLVKEQTKLRRKGITSSYNLSIKSDNGKMKMITATISPKFDVDGNFEGSFAIFRDNTEFLRQQSALKDSEETLRILLDNISGSVFAHDLDGNIRITNKKSSFLLGYSEEELLSMNVNDIDKSAITRNDREIIWHALKDGGTKTIESTHTKKDGTSFPVEVYISSITYKNEPIMLGIANDITERKNAEQKLKESEERFRSILNASPGIIYQSIIRPDGYRGFVYLSQSFEDITGYSVDHVTENPEEFLNNIPADDKKLFEENLMLSYKTLRPFNLTHRLNLKDGKTIWLDNRSITERKPDGSVVFTGVATDITEIKLAEEFQQQNIDRLKAIINIYQDEDQQIEEFLDIVLNKAVEFTQSKIGYLFFYDDQKKEFSVNSWSKEAVENCNIPDLKTKYQLDETGIWGEAVRQAKPIIMNDYQQDNPLKKGYPDGHVELKTFMTIPVVRRNKIVAVVGVANRHGKYTESDVLQLTLLMDGVWRTVERKEEEKYQQELIEKIKQSKSELEVVLHQKNQLLREISESEQKMKLLNNCINEMLALETLEDFYDYITNRLHELYKNSLVLFVSIDEENMMTKLEVVKGLDSKILNSVISTTGFNPIGRSYKLLQGHHKIFKSGVFTEYESGLAEYASSEFPTLAAKSLQKLFGIKKIYTIGINKEDKLLGVVHFFAMKEEIRDSFFIELFIHQVGIVMERKIIEDSLRQRTLELMGANTTKDKFFSIIAHDLRSPLSGIMRLTEVVSADMINMSITELNEIFGTLHRSSSYLFKLLDNLLQWSRVNRNMIDFKPFSMPLLDIIDEALSVLIFKAEERKIEIVYDVEESIVVWVDESMLLTVFRNILSNAIKFSEENGLIEINAYYADNKWIEVSIKDHGIGIKPELLPDIFKLEKVTSTIGIDGERGSGLGLILCKEFIERHGGDIELESSIGLGTTVKFTLPRYELDEVS